MTIQDSLSMDINPPCSFGWGDTAGTYHACQRPAATQTEDGDLVCMDHGLFRAQLTIAASIQELTLVLQKSQVEFADRIAEIANSVDAIDDRLQVIAWYSTPLLFRIWSVIRQKLYYRNTGQRS